MLRKLRPTLRKKKKAVEMYVYTPLVGKNGYVMEYRHPQYTMTFHYKYKENSDGTLTKIGTTISLGQVNDEKDYIFYQTVADKEQIALEHKWMSQLRTAGSICLTADIRNDWSDIMQHNNKLPITDNIQRRRLREVLGNLAYQQTDICKDSLLADASPSSSYSYSNNSLLNVNIPQRNSKTAKKENKPTKHVHLEHPTFSKTAPVVHVYDPEESLVYKECQCDYCRYADYDV
ncbi:10500_t:CDS:1 [Paraglomus occultum]|uniref:10500_t:CDS:1 n=1 Tax=Paraglomus occultum TaxID=144539 RepID=A0A9N9ABQ0_9GLOM|nr:10500_t:CDS:1 [Paraglomus occultum]